MHSRLPLLLALLPALGLPAAGQAPPPEDPTEEDWRDFDGVAMIVNEDIVTLRELDRMLKTARGSADTTTPQDNQALLAQVAESAVLERLWIQAGANVGIPASDVELTVDRFLADTRRDLSAQQTSDWMAGRGAADLGELREKTRDELYWTFWVRTARGEAAGGLRASRDRYVRPGQLHEAYQINESLFSAPPTAIFQFLALSTAAWGDAETAREALEGMREEILAGGDMGAMVDEYGAALRDSRGITPRMPLSAVDSPTLMAFAEGADEGALSEVMPIEGEGGGLQGYQIVRIISRTDGQPAPDFEDPALQTSIAQRLIKGWDEARINLSSDELWRTAFIRTPPVLELTPPWVRRSQR